MSAETLLKKSILNEKGWVVTGDHYVHPDQPDRIWAADVPKLTVPQLKEILG